MKNEYQTIILGAGVAGMTASIYLKRANIDCCILDGDAPGGQINRTAWVENYPGYTKIEGPELAMKMFNQIQDLGTIYKYGKVQSIVVEDKQIKVVTDLEELYCSNLIIATGRKPKKLGIPGEEQYTNRGISWCAVCDGPMYKGKKVAVLGGGRAALEEALYLSNLCESVTLIHRRDEFRAEDELVERVKKNKNITLLTNKDVKSFEGDDKSLSNLEIEDRTTKEITDIAVDGCFIYIGEVPNTEFISNKEILNEKGYVKVNSRMETEIPHIYACGDCIEKELYQIVTATSEGAIAANRIINQP